MTNQFKIKFVIFVAIIIPIALFGLVSFQIFKISQAEKEIKQQQEQIEDLQNRLDYFENKLPNGEHDSIGENK